ncbi:MULTISPECIES: hypothetical protein [Marinobacter]|uniref:hypothetical protein n=1 Tax=Marinobacter TaxID=2742 RepID=UPI000DAB5D2A|nr:MULTISPECIES: hypothetical protein [Marinobacter]
MKRLYYLTRTIDSVSEISEDLHDHGVTDWRFHIVSRDEAGLYTHSLHRAGVLDRTDLVRYVERGVMIGALLAFTFILTAQVIGVPAWPMSAWIALLLFAVLAGGWLGGFGGIGAEHYRIRRFHQAIDDGQYLVMVDCPAKHLVTMKHLMAENHPEAQLQGASGTHTNPFAAADGRVHIV